MGTSLRNLFDLGPHRIYYECRASTFPGVHVLTAAGGDRWLLATGNWRRWLGRWRFPVPLFWHTFGQPETVAHRVARVAFAHLDTVLNWRLPKWLGLDQCFHCGTEPCGTRVGSRWLCPLHSCSVAPEGS